MIQFPRRKKSPIGIDIGACSVKLIQLSVDRSRVELSRATLTNKEGAESNDEELIEALQQAYNSGNFRGRDAVLCVSNNDLFLQNIRVAKSEADLDRRVIRDAAERLPYPSASAELRFLRTAEIRQGQTMMREVIVMAAQRTAIDHRLNLVEQAGFAPIGLEVEPIALARSFWRQQRRREEQNERAMIVHVGYSRSIAVIVQESEIEFIKYIDIGGRELDRAVASHLHLQLSDVAALRGKAGGRSNDFRLQAIDQATPDTALGRRRVETDDREEGFTEPIDDCGLQGVDADLAASVSRAMRPVFDRLAHELAKCAKYYSVTFRGSPLQCITLGGGEATEPLRQCLAAKLKLRCELSDSLRGIEHARQAVRAGNWDVAMGLALKETR